MYITEKSDFLCFLIVLYLDSYHINVCPYRPVIMNERDATQQVPDGIVQY